MADMETRATPLVFVDTEIVELAEELGRLLGVSATAAVVEAVRRAHVQEMEFARRRRLLDEITSRVRAHLPADMTSDHSWLYDENGLPA